MTDYWFYHLETSALKGVLPDLLDKTLTKGWRALVKMPEDQLAEMDEYLWTYKDDSFLPHGRDDEPQADQNPVVLSANASSSDSADCVFLIGGADIEVSDKTSRCIVMINGRDESDVAAARARWKTLKAAGANLSYWQQSDRGKWEKRG